MSGSVMLAIETSQRIGSVALRDASGEVHIDRLHQAKRHDDDLMPAIDRLFRTAGTPQPELSTVAVSIGPGGFTGLRIAVTTAKMLGETIGAALIGVPSAMVAAELCEVTTGPIGVALASKRDTFWLTEFDRSGGNEPWVIRGTPGISNASRLASRGFSVLLADEYLPEDARAVCESHSIEVITPLFEASACLTVGTRLLNESDPVDPLHLVPLYPREPEAVEVWERRQGRRHQSG